MTVSTETNHNEYTGNDVTTSFPYTFRIFKKSDLVVFTSANDGEDIKILRVDTDYTVTSVGGFRGGNVVLKAPLAAGVQISISRELPATQETSLRNQGKFFPEVHEDAFDKLTMLIQQVRNSFSLALRKPSFLANYYDAVGNYIRNLRDPSRPQDAATKSYVDKQISGNTEGWQGADKKLNEKIDRNQRRTIRAADFDINPLPPAEDRAGKVPSFDRNGQLIVVAPASGSAVDVLNQLASGNGSLIGLKYGDLSQAPIGISPRMFGGKAYPFDSSAALQKAGEAAELSGMPLVLDQDYGYTEVKIQPTREGSGLVVLGNGNALRQLDWALGGSSTITFGFAFSTSWFNQRPRFEKNYFIVKDLNMDGGFHGDEFAWDAPSTDKKGVGYNLFTSAEFVMVDNTTIENSQKNGLGAFYPRAVETNGFKTRNLGGHAYEPGDHDSYADSIVLRMLRADAKIDINGWEAKSLGYPSAPMSRIGLSIQFTEGEFTLNFNNPDVRGFERSLHIEEVSGDFAININGGKMLDAFCNVHLTKGAGAYQYKAVTNINNAELSVCKNTFYKAGDFQLSESSGGWVRDSHGSTDDSDNGIIFNINNTKLSIATAMDGNVYPVTWGGNVNMIGGEIDYNGTASQKAYGYLRASGGVQVKGLITSGYYFFPYSGDSRKNTIELDNCHFHRHASAVAGQPVLFGHALNIHRDIKDYAINCTVHGLVTLPINEFVHSGNRFVFDTEADFTDARNRTLAGVMTKTTYDFPPKGCMVQVTGTGKQLVASPMANALVDAGYVSADGQVDLREITAGLGAGFYTIVLAPSTSRTAVGMGGITPPTVLGSGKMYMVFSVSNDGTVSNANATNYGRNLTGDQLNLIFTPATRTFSRDPAASSALVNIPWALYSGDVVSSIFKG